MAERTQDTVERHDDHADHRVPTREVGQESSIDRAGGDGRQALTARPRLRRTRPPPAAPEATLGMHPLLAQGSTEPPLS